MADFCVQCAEELGFPTTDLAGITKAEEAAIDMYCVVICEGCGVIQVDPDGRCISKDCLRQHGAEQVEIEVTWC